MKTIKIKSQTELQEEGKTYTGEYEEVDTGAIVQLKIFHNKTELIEKHKPNTLYNALLSEDGVWINKLDLIELEEKPEPLPKENKTINKLTEYNKSVKNGARLGMIVNNAVSIAIKEMERQNKDTINVERIKELIINLDKLITDYENGE